MPNLTFTHEQDERTQEFHLLAAARFPLPFMVAFGVKTKADADLLAASPTLLNALIPLLRQCEHYLGPMLCGGDMTIARVAICEALGGDPERVNDGEYTNDLIAVWEAKQR